MSVRTKLIASQIHDELINLATTANLIEIAETEAKLLQAYLLVSTEMLQQAVKMNGRLHRAIAQMEGQG